MADKIILPDNWEELIAENRLLKKQNEQLNEIALKCASALISNVKSEEVKNGYLTELIITRKCEMEELQERVSELEAKLNVQDDKDLK